MTPERRAPHEGAHSAAGKNRRVPVIQSVVARTAIGAVLLVGSAVGAASILQRGRPAVLVAGNVVAWLVALILTDMYEHKYPQRYATYVLASRAKAAIVMAALLAIVGGIAGQASAPWCAVWLGFGLFVVADSLVSLFSRRESESQIDVRTDFSQHGEQPTSWPLRRSPIDRAHALLRLRATESEQLVEFVGQHLPSGGGNGTVVVLDRQTGSNASELAGVVVARRLLNEVYRLDEFLRSCAESAAMGGYVVVRYAPLEESGEELRRRYGRILAAPASALLFLWRQALPKTPGLSEIQYALTRKGHHALATAEVWGRLAYCGLRAAAELSLDGERAVLAQRQGPPVENRTPSYYPIIALEKVGLDGRIMRLHKLRSMHPYSEFLQKRMYEEHGLTATGKFANDFRITRFGRFVRRYWLDELPQVFDWLRGDVKLVGMRATSPQYLGLYPREVVELYVRVKPGLVPPIFDESTNGFDRIVEVERAYLERYLEAPVRTDVTYFLRTARDILHRGVRGK